MTTPRDAPLYSWAPIDLAETVTLPNGDVETDIDVLELVPQEQKGGAGKFHATAERAAEMIRNYERERSRNYKPPFVLEHTGREAVGWLEGLRHEGTRLKARVKLLRDFAADVRAGKWKYVSPEFNFDAHSSTGEPIGAKVFRVAVTNTPHQKGADGLPVGAFQLAEIPPGGNPMQGGAADAGVAQGALTPEAITQALAALVERLKALEAKVGGEAPIDPGAAGNPKDVPMDDKDKKALADAQAEITRLSGEIEKLRKGDVSLTEKDAEITKLTEQVASSTKQLADKDAEIKRLSDAAQAENDKVAALTASVKKLEEVRTADEICELVRIGLTEKYVLTPAQVKDHEADPIKWLAESAFNGVAGLRKHVETAPKVAEAVQLAERTGHGGTPARKGDVQLSDADLVRGGFVDKDGKPDRARFDRAVSTNAKRSSDGEEDAA